MTLAEVPHGAMIVAQTRDTSVSVPVITVLIRSSADPTLPAGWVDPWRELWFHDTDIEDWRLLDGLDTVQP